MTAAWALDLPTGEKIVLLSLADNANDNGHCWPSMAAIAKRAGMTTRGAQLIVQRLEAAGHIHREQVTGKGCNYFVHPQETAQAPERRSPPPPNVIRPEPASPPNETAQAPERRSPKSSRTVREKVQASPSPSPSAKPKRDFDRWWQVYPRKVGKGAAEKAYLVACRVVPPDKLLVATEAYAASRADEDPQFTPHPATWLRRGSYDDPIEERPLGHRNGMGGHRAQGSGSAIDDGIRLAMERAERLAGAH